MHWLRIGLAASLFPALACLVVAQQADPTPAPAITILSVEASKATGVVTTPAQPGVPAPPAPPAPSLRDPTLPSARLREAMEVGKAPNLVSTGPTHKSPLISLKGRVLAKDRPPTAILEVDGKLYVVGKGSTLNGPGNSVLKIVELNKVEVRVEVSPQNETITLR